MTIFVDAQPLSGLVNYRGLVESVQRWLNRTDLQDSVPDFIRLAEARFRRVLVMPDMETDITVMPGAILSLPADFDSLRAFGITGQEPLDQVAPSLFGSYPMERDGVPVTGLPRKFTVTASVMRFWPVPDRTYAARMTYRANIPSLGANVDSNWLLAKHPDVYLYGTILQAEAYGWNDERIPTIKAALDEALIEVMQAGTRQVYGSGPLTMKTPIRDGVYARW